MTLGLRSWVSSIAVAGAALSACNVDPGTNMGFTDPCHQLQGDLTCQSLFSNLPYCSLCTTENAGCVMMPPALVCQPEVAGSTTEPEREDDSTGDSTGAVDTTTALDSTGMGSTGEPPCEVEGELDPACIERDETRPFCFESACVGCEGAGGDEFCGALDSLAPACDLSGGGCVPCGDAGRPICLDATPVCDDGGSCLACTAHEQCSQSACHLGPDDPLLGHCFAPEEVWWIDADAPCPGQGTEEEPYCSLQDTAAMVVPGDARVLRVLGGSAYAERASFSGEMTVAIIGDGYPQISGNPGQQAATLLFDDGVTAYVQGVQLIDNPLTHGLMCNLSYARIEDTHIRDNGGWGVFDFDPCELDIQRTAIVGNEDGGIRLHGGHLELTNASVGLNGVGGNSTGVRIEDGEADILYSTIIGNNGVGADSIECINATGSLRNSIVTGLEPLSIALDCFPLLMEHNAVDSANFASGTNVEVDVYNEIFYNNPAAGDFTLSAPPLTPFGDVALWMEGDPQFDADGTPRPIDGSTGFVGVDEPL